jgi:hypothetical protein
MARTRRLGGGGLGNDQWRGPVGSAAPADPGRLSGPTRRRRGLRFSASFSAWRLARLVRPAGSTFACDVLVLCASDVLVLCAIDVLVLSAIIASPALSALLGAAAHLSRRSPAARISPAAARISPLAKDRKARCRAPPAALRPVSSPGHGVCATVTPRGHGTVTPQGPGMSESDRSFPVGPPLSRHGPSVSLGPPTRAATPRSADLG